MPITYETASHDRSRQPSAKYRTRTRRQERRAKSAMLFLAFVFPA